MTDKPKDLSGSFLQPHQRVLQSTVGCIVSPEMHARTHKGDLAKLVHIWDSSSRMAEAGGLGVSGQFPQLSS